MGKSADGAVWLSDQMLSAYDYWQYWRNAEDADVGRFLRLFTELSNDEIVRLELLEGVELNEAKKILATEITGLCHGQNAAEQAAKSARMTFEEGALGKDLPTIDVDRGALESGIPVYELLCKAGLASSNGEARRLIKGGGGKINDQRIASETYAMTPDDLNSDGIIKLSAGKKRHALVRVT